MGDVVKNLRFEGKSFFDKIMGDEIAEQIFIVQRPLVLLVI